MHIAQLVSPLSKTTRATQTRGVLDESTTKPCRINSPHSLLHRLGARLVHILRATYQGA